MVCYFYPARSAGWMTCYFGKHDRIAIEAVILPKIPKIAFHNINGYSLGVALMLVLFLYLLPPLFLFYLYYAFASQIFKLFPLLF
jgi:hypothetical protein